MGHPRFFKGCEGQIERPEKFTSYTPNVRRSPSLD
jgi:hypothetical protein